MMQVKYHGHFRELPVGHVKPRGWIQQWLVRQADGMSGHPEHLGYPFDTPMFAGIIPAGPASHGHHWWPYEQSGYFVDAAVRLARLIDHPAVTRIARANLDYILSHSAPGHLGASSWGWPNAVVGRALMAEHGATGDTRLARILTQSLPDSDDLAHRQGYGFEQALYLYGLSGDPRLLGFARRAYEHYFLSDPRSFSHADRIRGARPLRCHGVTAAEQLKLLPLMFAYTGDRQALELANLAYRKVERHSLMPDGAIVSSEAMGPTAFNSLHETCDITDWSWSMGYLLMAGGDAHWADLIEQATFNALPGAVTKDFRQHQYFSAANQIVVSSLGCPRFKPTRMSYRAAHDTECCTGNVNRAMPNYVHRMWMQMDGGLAATLLGPCEIQTRINGRPVTILEDTEYPFREAIRFRLRIQRRVTFTLALRIPEWCHAAAVCVNGLPYDIECRPGTFARVHRAFRDADVVVLVLPMPVRLRHWFNGRAVSVHRGPLVFPLKIEERRVEIRRDAPHLAAILKAKPIGAFPAVEFYPRSEWRWGMDQVPHDAPDSFRVIESPMTDNPFLSGQVPVRIEAPLRTLPLWSDSATPSPPYRGQRDVRLRNAASLPRTAQRATAGPPRNMTLVPYGSTHLRLTTFPIIKSRRPGR